MGTIGKEALVDVLPYTFLNCSDPPQKCKTPVGKEIEHSVQYKSMSNPPPVASSRHPKPGISQNGRIREMYMTESQAVPDAQRPLGLTGQPTAQTVKDRKGIKVQHEGIPTPSEDEEDETAGDSQGFMSMEAYYSQIEQDQEDNDPEANVDDDHQPMLSHPPIATQDFLEEEDELFSSPIAPRPLATSTEGQNLNGKTAVHSAQNPQSDGVRLELSNSVINEGNVVSPQPVRHLQPGNGSTLSVLQMDAHRDPETPSPLPRDPLKGHKIPTIDFFGRKNIEQSHSVFGQGGMKDVPLPSYRPSSAGPLLQLPMGRQTKFEYPRSQSPHHDTPSRPSSVASFGHSTSRRLINSINQPDGVQGASNVMRRALPVPKPWLAAPATSQPRHAENPSQPVAPILQVTAPSPMGLPATQIVNELPSDAGIQDPLVGMYLHPSATYKKVPSLEASNHFRANDIPIDAPDVPIDVATPSDIPDNISEVEDEPSPGSEAGVESSEPRRTGRLQAESISRIEDAANRIWHIINETTKLDVSIQPSHIINWAFPSTVTHKMSYWNVFLAKYRANNLHKDWNKNDASQSYNEFKESFPNDEWKGILVEYAKIMDLDAGQMTRGKRQTVFRNTFTELAKKLQYHARRDGFEAIMAIVGANPKDDGPSMVAFHETDLAKGFADKKLRLKNDWAATHLRTYVQNRKSDEVVSLHRQTELQPEQETSPSTSDIPTSVNDKATDLAYQESPMPTSLIPNDASKKRDTFTTYKLYRPDNAKSAHLSYTVNFSALLVYHDVAIHGKEAPPMTQDGFPDYRSCPWRRVGKSLQERNMILTGWPPMVPLPINDKMDPTYLSKSASSLTDSQRIRFAKALEDSEIHITQAPPSHQNTNTYVFVRTAVDNATNTYHEGVYCPETEISRSRTVKVAIPTSASMDSNRIRTRQNTKNANKQKGGIDPKPGEKRVAFEEPANDTDVELEGPKKRRSRGAKKQKVVIAQNMETVKETSTIHNAQMDQPKRDRPGDQGPSETVRERPKPRPAYKKSATSTGPMSKTGLVVTTTLGLSTLQAPGPSIHKDSEIDAFFGSPYEFEDLPAGSGYVEIHSDDEHLAQTGPVLNHVGWGNAEYANIRRYSGNSASDNSFSQPWNHCT